MNLSQNVNGKSEIKSICKHHHMMYLAQNAISGGRNVVIHLQNIKKTVKTGLVSIFLLQVNKWALKGPRW